MNSIYKLIIFLPFVVIGCAQNVIDKNACSSGIFVEEFEGEFAKFCGAKHCIAVNSGTSALHLALIAHGIKENDEVIPIVNQMCYLICIFLQ